MLVLFFYYKGIHIGGYVFMEVFSTIIACLLVLGLSAFILITLYTIVRDLLRKNKKKASENNNDISRKEEVK